MNTHDRAVWRNGILRNRLTRALAQKMMLNDDDVLEEHMIKMLLGLQ